MHFDSGNEVVAEFLTTYPYPPNKESRVKRGLARPRFIV